jgi:DNA helicase-2/ATP-dependent DNA helicase PcrA
MNRSFFVDICRGNMSVKSPKNYLDQLNEAQRAAVVNTEGPMMIVAGAGSGKTRVLTFRIAHLIEKGVDAFNIMSLTFTNKAAREMRERIEKMVGAEAKNLWMGTFHSIFARILRIEAAKIGYPSNFTIYDSDDSKSLIKTILKEQELNPDTYKPGMVLSRISLSKNNFISPAQYQNHPEVQAEDVASGKPKLGLIYELYMKRCFAAGAMDFDDLLLKTYQLIMEHPDVLNKYQQKFKYILVDEYQDTNHIQYLIIRKLAAANRNICVVGDDAQSIYAFRGANIKNILNFEKDYPDLRVFKLEQNYRSTKTIVDAASDIIRKNKHQLEKSIWTENETGHKIKVYRAQTDNEEGAFVAHSIFEEKMKERLENKDFAILYRTNSQSRAFEEALRKLNIGYRIIGGLSFYQRKEIKDLLAYFRLAVNPKDEEAFKRIINYPARGIGDTTVSKIILHAQKNGFSLWEVARHIDQFDFDSRVRRAVSDWADMIESFQLQMATKNAHDLAMEIAGHSGIIRVLYEDKTIEGISRYENIQELLSAIKEFTERPDVEDKSLSVFLQDVALLTDSDTKDDDEDKITMMTIHQAKGLEFPVVFIVGLEENLFPSHMSLSSREDLEEERRLFYVALTRARKKAFLSYATQRFRWGQLVHSEASRFIDEINPTYLDYQLKQAKEERKPVEEKERYVSPAPVKKPQAPPPTYTPSPDFKPGDVSGLEPGMKVEHNRFGFGQVVAIDGKGEDKKANILFQSIGEKQILLKYAKMRVL